ncbi:MAG: cob(I)yrinic acid a,c-diamide adenosyltransferase [Thermodesulfobacteriota bacterium]
MDNKGLLHIYTGDGKGKTTASVGLAVRAAGGGLNVLFVQFFKEDAAESGEKEIFRNNIDSIELHRSNCRHPFFTGSDTDDDLVRRQVRETFTEATGKVAEGGIDLVVFDEMMAVLKGGWVEFDELVSFLDSRPAGVEVVLTGRNAPPELVKIADYVTEMLSIKHPFDSGQGQRKGIEY